MIKKSEWIEIKWSTPVEGHYLEILVTTLQAVSFLNLCQTQQWPDNSALILHNQSKSAIKECSQHLWSGTIMQMLVTTLKAVSFLNLCGHKQQWLGIVP